jgi:hypothetical protein
MPPFTFARVLVLVACIVAAVYAVLILLVEASWDTPKLIGGLFAVLALYLASLLVP